MPTHKSPEPGSPGRVQPDFSGRETLFVGDRSGACGTWLNRVEVDREIQRSWRRSKVRACRLTSNALSCRSVKGLVGNVDSS